jgi:hypothetical protein
VTIKKSHPSGEVPKPLPEKLKFTDLVANFLHFIGDRVVYLEKYVNI